MDHLALNSNLSINRLNTPVKEYRQLKKDEFSFVVWVCEGDYALALRMIKRLRQFNSQKILVIGDNVKSFPYLPNLDFVDFSDSPKTLEYGDQYMFDRWKFALRWMETRWICRLDPDNQIMEEVRPIAADWFGFLYDLKPLGVGCSGGSSGYSRETLERLVTLDNKNYRDTYRNGDGITFLADDTLLIRYIGTTLKVTPEPWSPIFADIVFKQSNLKEGWMITHPSIDKPLKAHLFTVVMDSGNNDREQLALELTSVGFKGAICTTNQKPYRDVGFTCFLNTPLTNKSLTYTALTVQDNKLYAGIEGPFIGELGTGLWESWFGEESCLHRKAATWMALNNTKEHPF